MSQKRCSTSREAYSLIREFIPILRNLPHSNDAYIVGGTVRDLLLCRDPVDVDIVVPDKADRFARTLLKKIDGTLFPLDKRRGIFRITTKGKSPPFYYDISPMRGGDIITDLSSRDFTIDALAIPLSDIRTIVDPYNGKSDIKKKRIKVISRRSFEDDPLRLLRAFRLASTLGFKIDPDTLNAIHELSSSLRLAARERIRDEFFRILSSTKSVQYLREMDKARLLGEPLTGLGEPEIKRGLQVFKRLEGLYHSLQELFSSNHVAIEEYLAKRIEEGITKGTLWKWISLYVVNNITEASMINALEGLRLGNRAHRLALSGVKHVQTNILDRDIKDKRSLYHYFKVTGEDGIGLTLYQLAAIPPAKNAYDRAFRNAEDAISWYLQEYKKIKISPLITGDDLIALFHIPSGPALGHLLDMVEENRALGLLTTKKDAISFLKKVVTNV